MISSTGRHKNLERYKKEPLGLSCRLQNHQLSFSNKPVQSISTAQAKPQTHLGRLFYNKNDHQHHNSTTTTTTTTTLTP